jgi:hypothetical protein
MAELLPADYSPTFALRLLLSQSLLVEAVFFTDHFNCLRTALVVRLLVDRVAK